MNETVCSWTELIWRDFFINREILYVDEDGAETWEIISDLHFVSKTRLIKVETSSGKVFTMNKDDDQKWKTIHTKNDRPVNKPRNKKKKK